ncbi:MAG: LacI family DNA-binding transcriptional regulator [Blautia sp.]|jgi:LacI family sucrose operon transcriptional repressor
MVRRLNINEIAKLAGVSRATVSRYLNQGYVSKEKQEQIRKVIEETGYQPSSQAQMLRTKRTKLIGVILPKINSDTVSRMVAGISDVLSKQGYQLLLANTNNDIQEELKYLNLFKDNQVDGILFIATIFTAKHKKLLRECKVPVVILGQHLEGYSCVYHDDYHSARQVTELLLEKGQVPGFIGVTVKDEAAGLSRRKGFEAALKKAHMACPKEQMAEAAFSVESGYEAMKRLLEAAPSVDSVFCATDNIAIGAMSYLKEIKKSIPQEIQIAGIGDTPLGNLVEPKLTTVHLFYKTSGMEAASMLLELLEDSSGVCKELKMGYRVIRKDSTR